MAHTEAAQVTLRPGAPAAIAWGALAAAAALIAAAGQGPLALVLFPVGLTAAAGLLGYPRLFLWLLVATSGVGFAWVDGLAMPVVGGHAVNLTGFHWGVLTMVAATLAVRTPWAPLPRLLVPYLLFTCVAAAGLLWAPSRFEALKNLIQYLAPLLIGWVAYRATRSREDVDRLRTAFWIGLVAAGAVAVGAAISQPELRGGGLGGALGARPFAIFLLPLLALALAGWREWGGAHIALACLIFGLALLTLSRTVAAVMLVLTLIASGGGWSRKVLGLLLVAFLGGVALQFEPLRERIFIDPRVGFTRGGIEIVGRGSEASLSLAGVDLSGRGILWVQTWLHARQAPVLGHGTGSSTHFLETTLRVGSSHPHNDYLRVFHDLGLVGLAAVLLAAVAVARGLRRLRARAATPETRYLASAALLAWLAYLLVALTDNGMVYVTFFTQNVFILIALALRAVELESGVEG
jgi:O-antigen ligase